MHRTDPPPLATWMLEHLTPADRDEALAGDLLEVFRSGKSSGWYWRQVLAACAVAWFRSLRARIPLLVFALLWSMLAPGWAVLMERVDRGPRISLVLRESWPFALAAWTALNAVFLWAGMLIYVAAQVSLRKTVRRQKLMRACPLALVLFMAAYAAIAVLANLLWYPGIVIPWNLLSPLHGIVDFQLWADVFRIPYLAALIVSLWSVIPQTPRSRQMQPAETEAAEISSQSQSAALVSDFDAFTINRFLAITVAAGFINAMIASFVFCHLPEAGTLTFTSLALRAVRYIVICTLAGVAGSWFYWKSSSSPFRRRSPLPFPLFALASSAGWVWIPCMALFYEQVSPAAAFVAMIAAFVLASGLRSVTRALVAPATQAVSAWEYGNAELFAESLYQPPFDARGYSIALALYGAGWALATRSNYTAALLLGFGAFLFAWERTARPDQAYENRVEYRRSTLRLACVVVPAVLVTIWALLNGFAHRDHVLAAQASSPHADEAKHKYPAASGLVLSGYESIILWPVPDKKQIVAPLPAHVSLFAKGTKQPLVLRFTGAYWYFQPPQKQPGPHAMQTHGTPLTAGIHSNNRYPLLMEARQNLSAPVRLAECREIQVALENRGNLAGPISMTILLTDSSAPGKASAYLGQQPLLTSEPVPSSTRSAVAQETLRFMIPEHADIHQFDTITVMFFPQMGSFTTAPQLAIDQFSLIPR